MKKAALITASFVLIGLAVAAFLWNVRDINRIVEGGPFDRSFIDGLYPDKEANIDRWFRTVLPMGTNREQAQRTLAPSFSIDLTSGRTVVIERTSGWAGGHRTEVFLRFEKGEFRDVVIHQHWVYL